MNILKKNEEKKLKTTKKKYRLRKHEEKESKKEVKDAYTSRIKGGTSEDL